MRRFLLIMLVLAPLVVGCATTEKRNFRGPVLSYVPAGGGASTAPAVQTPGKKKGGGASIKKTPTVMPTTPAKKKGVEQQQQYNRSAPVVEEDPLVIQARAIALQNIKDRETWKAACFELRRVDMYMTYEDCRRILGDERYIGGYYGYGRSVGGSVIGNSGGKVRWR